MKRIVISSILLLLAVLTLQAQKPTNVVEVLTWGVEGIGYEENKIARIDAKIAAVMFVQDGKTFLLLLNTDTNEFVFTVQIKCLYLDTNAGRNDNYIGMRSEIETTGLIDGKGEMILSLNKSDDALDLFHFDLSGKSLYIAGHIIDEENLTRLIALATAGIMLKDGHTKLKEPLEDYILKNAK